MFDEDYDISIIDYDGHEIESILNDHDYILKNRKSCKLFDLYIDLQLNIIIPVRHIEVEITVPIVPTEEVDYTIVPEEVDYTIVPTNVYENKR